MLRMQDGQPLEAVIMAGLAHPSIVHTIAHSVVRPRSPALARHRPCQPGPCRATPRARAPRRRRLAGARAGGEAGLARAVHVWPAHPGMSAPGAVQVIRPRGERAGGGGAGLVPRSALQSCLQRPIPALALTLAPLFERRAAPAAQVPAKDIEAWDSAHEGAASEAARKAQTRRAGSAKHGNAWLLLEFMDRGCLQARRPRAAAGPPRPEADPQAEPHWSAQRPGDGL
jgi:hypothetical protein